MVNRHRASYEVILSLVLEEIVLAGGKAYERGLEMEAVIGSAPGWAESWTRAQIYRVEKDLSGFCAG